MAVSTKQEGSPLPKYAQIRHQLQALIKSEAYSEGSPFYSEKDICEKFGVSMITARRVLDDLKNLGFINRRRGVGTFVQKGKALSSASTHKTIGILLYDTVFAFVPPMVELMKGVGEEIREKGCDLKVLVSGKESVTRLVENARVDGLIVAYQEITDEELDELEVRHQALVTFNRWTVTSKIHSIGDNEILTMLLVGEHLAGLGHKRIAFFHGPREYGFTGRYLQGYRLIVKRFGLDEDEGLMVETGRKGLESVDQGLIPSAEELAAFQHLVQSSHRPTAFIMPTWRMAQQAIERARGLGLQVPRDVSIVSLASPYDEDAADMPADKITHIHVSSREIGRQAARVLLKLMAGEPCPLMSSVKVELAVRTSTGPSPAAVQKK